MKRGAGAARANELHLSLPIPPSVNHCYRRFTDKSGRRMNVTTKKARDWIDGAVDAAREEMRRTGWVPPQGEKVVLEYTPYWPDRRRRDPSNLEKIMLDALCAKTKERPGIVMDDDQFVLPRCMDFGYDKAEPRVEIVIRRRG